MPAEAAACAWTLQARYRKGAQLPPHSHPAHQIMLATAGVMTVLAGRDAWVVAPQRALVVPARVRHSITMHGAVSLTTIYVRPDLLEARACRPVAVSPLLRELILHACTIGTLAQSDPAHVRLLGVLGDQLTTVPAAPLHLVLPTDRRALRVAEWLRRHPGETRPVERLAAAAGASKRTLERLFAEETGMSVARWRRQARLLAALPRLARGEPVAAVALDVGYTSASAFIDTFKRTLGATPGEYFRPAARR